MDRAEANRRAKEVGAEVARTVDERTDLLVAGRRPGAVKLREAERLGVRTVDEATFVAWLNGENREVEPPHVVGAKDRVGYGEDVPLQASLLLHYAAARGPARWRRAVVHAARVLDVHPARILLNVHEIDAGGTRHFRADRVLEAADLETGEIVDLGETLVRAGLSSEIVHEAVVVRDKGIRTIEHGLDFSGPGEGLNGWKFHVPPVFRPALDLKYLEYGEVGGERDVGFWTQGWPALYDFHAGDAFYDSAAGRTQPWGEALRHVSQVLTVLAAEPDRIQRDGLRSGGVSIELWSVWGGKLRDREIVETDQRGLVRMLRTGERPTTVG
jgi:hypothetical protein